MVTKAAEAWPFSYILLALVLSCCYGLYALFSLLDPILGVCTMILSKFSEVSAVLSEQGAELGRLRSLLSEVLTAGPGSGSKTTAPTVELSSWQSLGSAIKSFFLYVPVVMHTVFHTVSLVLVTTVTGVFSWLDWSCQVITDIIKRVYCDPRGLLYNLLLLGCAGETC